MPTLSYPPSHIKPHELSSPNPSHSQKPSSGVEAQQLLVDCYPQHDAKRSMSSAHPTLSPLRHQEPTPTVSTRWSLSGACSVTRRIIWMDPRAAALNTSTLQAWTLALPERKHPRYPPLLPTSFSDLATLPAARPFLSALINVHPKCNLH